MKDIRRRHLPTVVWIPLRTSEHIESNGEYGYVEYKEEFLGVGSVAIPIARRDEALKLKWSDIGLIHTQGAWATADSYKAAEIYQYRDNVDLGVELVLEQTFPGDEPKEWHLSQDLVIALGLLREGDEWVRPTEDYCVVARLRRGNKNPISLEIKNEFLRDYLAARKMLLRVSSFRSRDTILENASHIDWPDGHLKESNDQDQFEARVIPIIEGGHMADGTFAVFTVSRTDVDPNEDVPRPGRETDENVKSTQREGKRVGRTLYRVIGELWRDETIEPADFSPRIRGDKVPTGVHYVVDASGTRAPSEELDNEDDPRWLWFRPEVILALIKHRGGGLEWYTQETGGVGCTPGHRIHFGINSANLVTVYAYDIASLPTWQQQIWAGFNVAPEGKVSRELLSAQMETKVADTAPPEGVLPEVLDELDKLFLERIGSPLFRSHSSITDLIAATHRFRALEPNGVLALAKDLIRLTADRIDAAALQKFVSPPLGETWGSLKFLEKYLATIVSANEARKVMGPLAGAYELRIADAHLPSGKLKSAYELARVDPDAPLLAQGFQLMASVVSALIAIFNIVRRNGSDGEQGH